ncbi:uncharacterized protein MELLADRAFT_66772 [Melampsora larici-populina 98AG31]|uniref:Alpha-type protein kinase domain-containing protein n=1 Tax=Melampsora larici-populina (strain 98AG31 / pathotype 3-4-7) TaxID=747676 RepID=F4S0I3_MELLP|nr:uncharacterized protein MELLADRAFT_66772 [Melampsora larici-populina 98AG31]EGG01772.1 hypothetical protein MELLADRAFT_66772 [Melampsora larici-populina 98AG31]
MSTPYITNPWDPPPPGKMDCASCSRVVPHLRTTICGFCIAKQQPPGHQLVHCDFCSIGYPHLTGKPPICGVCLSKGLTSSVKCPRRNADNLSLPESIVGSKRPRAADTYIQPPRMNPNPSTSFRFEKSGRFHTPEANLASEEESSLWGRKRRMESAESKKVGAANTKGGRARLPLTGILGPASRAAAVNVTAQLIIAGTPKSFTTDNGVKTYSSFINTQAPDWPVSFARDAWNDIISFCNNDLKFPSKNLCSMYQIFPLPIEFSDLYISLGVAKDHMTYEQIRIYVETKAIKKSQRGPSPKINITLIFTPGVYLQHVSEDEYDSSSKALHISQKKRMSNSTSVDSEGTSAYYDEDDFEAAVRQSLEKPPYVLRSQASGLSATTFPDPLQKGQGPPGWWFDPINESLPLLGSNTGTSGTLESGSGDMSNCIVGNMNMLSGVLGSDFESSNKNMPDLRFLGEVAVPISTTWANPTRAPIWKNVILLAIHVEPVSDIPEIGALKETLNLQIDPLFETIRKAGISVKPWRVSFHVDLSDVHPSSVSKEQFGAQIMFEGSLFNVLARKRMEDNLLVNYLEELQMNCQARKLLYDFQEFVAGHPGANTLLVDLVKKLEVVRLFIISEKLWTSPDSNDLWAVETYQKVSPKKYVSHKLPVSLEESDLLFQALQAWSHWTFNLYKGEAFLAEISAKGHVLSQFQMVDREAWWSSENSREKGVASFLNSHKCLPTCLDLGFTAVKKDGYRPRRAATGLRALETSPMKAADAAHSPDDDGSDWGGNVCSTQISSSFMS